MWFTAEDLEQMPPDLRVELVRGELRKMPPPAGEEHGSITFTFGLAVGNYVAEHDLGRCYAAETGFKIERDPDTVRGPDFAFVRRDRLTGPPQPGYLPAAPDLVLETRSPSDRTRYVDDKVALWLEAGVRMALVLDPARRTLTVYRAAAAPQALGADDTFDGEDVLPGFTLPVRRLFRAIDTPAKEQQ